jgi:hypothetical protein
LSKAQAESEELAAGSFESSEEDNERQAQSSACSLNTWFTMF